MEDDLFGQPNELLRGLGSIMDTTNTEHTHVVEEAVMEQCIVAEILPNSVSLLEQSIEDSEMSFGGAYEISAY
jgi:hypothetical protein